MNVDSALGMFPKETHSIVRHNVRHVNWRYMSGVNLLQLTLADSSNNFSPVKRSFSFVAHMVAIAVEAYKNDAMMHLYWVTYVRNRVFLTASVISRVSSGAIKTLPRGGIFFLVVALDAYYIQRKANSGIYLLAYGCPFCGELSWSSFDCRLGIFYTELDSFLISQKFYRTVRVPSITGDYNLCLSFSIKTKTF